MAPSLVYDEATEAGDHLLVLALRARRSERERRELGTLFSEIGETDCRASAKRNHAECAVLSGIADALGADALSTSARAFLTANEDRVLRLLRALRAFVERLRNESCPAAVVEGGGILLGSQLPLRAYGSGDFDVLLDDRGFARAPSLLADAGFLPDTRRSGSPTRLEFGKTDADGTKLWLEVGVRSFDRKWIPLAYRDRSQIWLSRRVGAPQSEGVDVLAPTDALAHVAMHTSLHSFVRAPGLRLHIDVDRIVSDNEIDWDAFVAEILAMGIRTRAFVSLSMAAGLLGTSVPMEVLERLAPPRTRWTLLRGLLARESIFANGRRKLAGANAVFLDMLIEERSPIRWLESAILPPADWMREHFARAPSSSLIAMHAHRAYRLATRWRPE